MKSILLSITVIMLNIIYMPMKLLKTKDKVVYISRQSNAENIDFKLIREKIQEQYKEIDNIVLVKKIEPGIINKISYCIETIRQMYHIATSKVVILDTYCITACVLKHKKETKIIQIWHALGAIKKFGYQTIDKPWGTRSDIAKAMHMHENYTYVLAPSNETAKLYKRAFNVTDSQIKYIGMPRVDYIVEKNIEMEQKIFNEYPELKEKENILYVPTFRKGQKVELDELIAKFYKEV